MLLFMGSLLLFFFGIQMVMIHLVSYATDSGISALVAATFIECDPGFQYCRPIINRYYRGSKWNL